VIRDMIHEAAEAAEAEDRLVVDVPAGLGLIADSFRLHHIFRNLFENACKYSPTDAPVLVKARQTQDSIEIEVCDGGPGIPEGSKEVVFQRFRRLSDPVASGVPGTGLGLYIAQRFARDLDAELSVGRSSEPGFPGARFVLQLPDLPAPG
jgi:K+-sensing histidine kinase KdpD